MSNEILERITRIEDMVMEISMPPGTRLLSQKEICESFKIGKDAFRQLINTPGFPKRIVIGEKTHRWRESEILRWLEQMEFNG